jgi:hypothetical protein
VQVELLPDIYKYEPRVKYWQEIANKVKNSDSISRKLGSAHGATRTKLIFADYHIHILDQIYKPNRTKRLTETPFWVQVETYSIIANLYSALDSLANEIRLIYGFKMPIGLVHIDHNKGKHLYNVSAASNCVRCQLDNIKDTLSTALNTELSSQWFAIFKELRNQFIHKIPPIHGTAITIGDPTIDPSTTVLSIPRNPANDNPQYEDVKYGIELSGYAHKTRQNVKQLVEYSYSLLQNKIT